MADELKELVKKQADAVTALREELKKGNDASEEKIKIVLEGLRGEESIAALCRREGINPNHFSIFFIHLYFRLFWNSCFKIFRETLC